MNSSVYIFGNLSSGYTQYPDEDFSNHIFQKFYSQSKATTQLTIHRDGNLMYYGYIRKLENDGYIGLCVVVNGLYINRLDSLFALFEQSITNFVKNGHLLHFNEQLRLYQA